MSNWYNSSKFMISATALRVGELAMINLSTNADNVQLVQLSGDAVVWTYRPTDAGRSVQLWNDAAGIWENKKIPAIAASQMMLLAARAGSFSYRLEWQNGDDHYRSDDSAFVVVDPEADRKAAEEAAAKAIAEAEAAQRAQWAAEKAAQGELDRLAESQALEAVRSYLAGNVSLPAGWSFESFAIETDTGFVGIGARAVRSGRSSMKAGTAQQAITSDKATAWKTLVSRFPSSALPETSIVFASCQSEDARIDPSVFDQSIGAAAPALPFKEPTLEIDPANQGFAADGQAPWDAQPDVVETVVPEVTGTIVGAGYAPTVGKYPAGFIDSLNLKIPNAYQVAKILEGGESKDGKKLDDYLAEFEESVEAKTEVGRAGTTNPLIKPLPNPYSYEGLDPVVVAQNPVDDGIGILPAQTQPEQAEQKAPNGMFWGYGGSALNVEDPIEKMQNLTSTDFLNMLAIQYPDTLKKVASIEAARSELNELIRTSSAETVENYLRNFDASSYLTTKVPAAPEPVTKTVPTSAVLVVIGLAVGLYLFTRARMN
jgi:hypothetical protein